MLMTKRFDYVAFEQIHLHPSVANHRPLNEAKVAHYADDILMNGLLEPLVVWERTPGEFFLVGGFHRLNAIRRIRAERPGYFDRVDVRVVTGNLDEIQALNLKLNADRLDARITDYFDAIIFMHNANWETNRIARFLDRSVAWVEDILRYAPGMDQRVRTALEEGKLSWNKAKAICKAVLEAPPGTERDVLDAQLQSLNKGASAAGGAHARPLTAKGAARRLQKLSKTNQLPLTSYSVSSADLLALLQVLTDKNAADEAVTRARTAFPFLWNE